MCIGAVCLAPAAPPTLAFYFIVFVAAEQFHSICFSAPDKTAECFWEGQTINACNVQTGTNNHTHELSSCTALWRSEHSSVLNRRREKDTIMCVFRLRVCTCNKYASLCGGFFSAAHKIESTWSQSFFQNKTSAKSFVTNTNRITAGLCVFK